MSVDLVDQLRRINTSRAKGLDSILRRTCGEAADHIAFIELGLDSLREQLADFRDAVLHERGALAESGMTCDQVNAVLREFDDRFIPDNQERAE
jgi:hypothetical protein